MEVQRRMAESSVSLVDVVHSVDQVIDCTSTSTSTSTRVQVQEYKYKYKYKSTRVQEYKSTRVQVQEYKYKYKSTRVQVQVQVLGTSYSHKVYYDHYFPRQKIRAIELVYGFELVLVSVDVGTI